MSTKIVDFVLYAALAGSLMIPGGIALGDNNADCGKRLEADRARIDRDAKKYGERSPAVDKDVARMDSDRSWCRDHHADWDHSKFDVGIYVKR
jgi:hypothetical protein